VQRHFKKYREWTGLGKIKILKIGKMDKCIAVQPFLRFFGAVRAACQEDNFLL
jgi:hypothetical protein